MGEPPFSSPGVWGTLTASPGSLGRRRKQPERRDWRALRGTRGDQRGRSFLPQDQNSRCLPREGGNWLMASRCASFQIGDKIARFQMWRKQKPNQTKPNLLGFHSQISSCLPVSIPHLKFGDSVQTCPRPLLGLPPSLPSFFFSFVFFIISSVSYLYIVLLMYNSCGADGPRVTRSQSLWISVPITHLAPVAISPRALWWWWRRLPRPLGAGAWVFFFFPQLSLSLSLSLSQASSATYLSDPRLRPA